MKMNMTLKDYLSLFDTVELLGEFTTTPASE